MPVRRPVHGDYVVVASLKRANCEKPDCPAIVWQAVLGGWKTMRVKWLVFGSAGAVFLAMAWLVLLPPDLIRVGASYTAKIICSNVFIARRDPQEVMTVDVQAPGQPVMRLMRVQVDHEKRIVRAGLLGLIGNGIAVHRSGTGCASVPGGDIVQAAAHQFAPLVLSKPMPSVWPEGDAFDVNVVVQQLLGKDDLSGPGMRGIAVVHRGKLIAQQYAPGFTQDTPLLGWSMTKSVTAAIVGILVKDGKLKLDQTGWWPTANPPDGREKISIADLMAMSSGLRFNEGYGGVSDVTRMLLLEPDMAAYVSGQPLEHPIGKVWNYSSGTTVFLSSIWQKAAGAESLSLPQRRLFAPLGMRSALIEADARGNLVGSSYMYATAQDWARFGQFLLQDGVWQGQRLLPEGFVAMMAKVAPASKGAYGQGQVWRWGPRGDSPKDKSPDTAFNLPADTFWMLGYDGQSVAIVPSKQLVVVRLGLTPDHLHYKPQAMLAAVVRALE